MKKYIYFLTAMLIVAGVGFCTPSFAVKHVVSVGNFFFSPANLSVNVGDTIRWVWSAGSHTTTSTPGAIPAGATSWDALINSSNTSYEYKVTVLGSYAYVCTPHAPGMAGTFTAASAAPTLSVSPSNRDVAAAASSTTFTVTSNSLWTSSSNSSWCTVTSGGSGNGIITANYSENTSVSQRVATIVIIVSGLPNQIVTVTQEGAAPVLTVGPANQNVQASAGTTTFNVVSNTTWTASSSASWCTVTASGSGNATVTASFSFNPTNIIRTATITITGTGVTPQAVTVTQAASTVGVKEQLVTDLKVYPNPTMGYFKVMTGDIKDQAVVISILDISGKQISSRVCSGAEEYEFNISKEPKGYYFIRIATGNSTQVRRIVLTD